MKKQFMNISCILLFLSIIAISYGAHLQANTEQFDMYQQYVMNNMAEMHPGDRLAPEFGIGLILASAWVLVGVVQASIFLLYVAGFLLLRTLRTCHSPKGPFIIVSMLFTGYCLFASYCYLNLALDSFVWRFYVRATGEFFAAAGLTFGAAAQISKLDLRSFPSILQWRTLKTKQTDI